MTPHRKRQPSSLMRVYSARGERQLASSAYERCRGAVEVLGIRPSPALEEAQRAIGEVAPRSIWRKRRPRNSRPPHHGRTAAGERALRRALRYGRVAPSGATRRM